ncbi:MAG: hypothetical protein R2692_00680 [Microbacterium sp.]
MFNIGARGQMLISAMFTGPVRVQPRPADVDSTCPLTLLAPASSAALWGGLVGLLKAKTGARGDLTIMLNYVAFYLLRGCCARPACCRPPAAAQTSHTRIGAVPDLLGPQFNEPRLGLCHRHRRDRVRVVADRALEPRPAPAGLGENPHAARAAGAGVDRLYIYAMLFAGGLAKSSRR